MDDNAQHLRNLAMWRKRKDTTSFLGDSVKTLVQRKVESKQGNFVKIKETWEQLLPESIRNHCKIDSFESGRLKIKVDSPAYRYELQMCSADLVEQFRQKYPSLRLSAIKFVIG